MVGGGWCQKSLQGGQVFGLGLLLLAAAWAYWPALNGPFLFDDFANLSSLAIFDSGVTFQALREYLQSGTAGPGGRPIALLSFLIDDFSWPSDPAQFKYTNLMLHLLNACLLAWVVVRLVTQLPGGLTRTRQVLLVVMVGFWLLSPYHMSSVMYVIQRMALLGATFVLAGLLLYLCGRQRLAQGQGRQGYLLIWAGYLVGAGLGSLAKENAALYVLMVPLIEWLCFSRQKLPAAWLLRLTLIVPAMVLLVAVASRWPAFMEQYQTFRDFSLSERLLSQVRALGYYFWRYLIPGVGYVGIYADGFEKSTGWLEPLSTLLWGLFHLGVIGAAILLRRRLPMLSLGVLFFYVAHSMESTVVPLELFFEHRNYLPSMLLLLGLMHVPRLSRSGLIAVLLALLCCLGLLRLQAQYWRSESLLVAIMMTENPTSERATLNYADYLFHYGSHSEAMSLLEDYAKKNPSGIEIALNLARLNCMEGTDTAYHVGLLKESVHKYRGKAAFFAQDTVNLIKLQAFGGCQVITLDDIEEFIELYAGAFLRDAESVQGVHVVRAMLQLYRGDFSGFLEQVDEALEVLPNPELALKLCWEMYQIGASAEACRCFNQQAALFKRGEGADASIVRSWSGYHQSLVDSYLVRRQEACGAVE